MRESIVIEKDLTEKLAKSKTTEEQQSHVLLVMKEYLRDIKELLQEKTKPPH